MRRLLYKIAIFAFCISLTQISYAVEIQSFSEAKRQIPKIFKQLSKPTTLYCGCNINYQGRKTIVDLNSCGYKVRKNAQRANRVEAEHIMSAHQFGKDLPCWKAAGRKQCSKHSDIFKIREGDLHNLYPAVGEVNGDRSNFKFAQNVRGPRNYGKCDMIIDRKRQIVTPPERSRGIVARAYLYMSQRYNIKLSASEISLFNQWNKNYPPTSNECKRNEIIAKIQGNDNPFVTEKCKR